MSVHKNYSSFKFVYCESPVAGQVSGNVMATVNDRKGYDGSNFVAKVMSAQTYYPFGMLEVGRLCSPELYRYGYNGQEMDNEVSGTGNTNTAMFWEYDTRLGRRWNVDPVVKQWESPYACFSGNPIINVDPNGDDDYYNKAGQYVGTYGTGTAIRITAARDAGQLNEWVNAENGLANVESLSKVVTAQENAQEALNQLYKESNEKQVERKAYIVLDVENATLSLEMQPQSPEDTKSYSLNIYDVNTFIDSKGNEYKVNSLVDQNTKIIVGQVHGHPDPPRKLDLTSGTTINMTSNKIGVSE